MSLKNAIVQFDPLNEGPSSFNPPNRKGRAKGENRQQQISPQTNPSSNAYGSGNSLVIFKLTDNNLDYIDNYYLQFTFTNQDAATYALTSSHFFINTIQLRINGVTVETIYNWQLYDRELTFLNANNSLQRGLTHNFSLDLATGEMFGGNAIAIGGSATYYLEFKTVLERSGINMALLNATNDVQLYVYLSNQQTITYASAVGRTLPTLDNLILYTKGTQISPEERASLAAKISSKGWSGLSARYQQLVISTQTLAANSQSPAYIIAGIDGTMQRVMVNIIPQAITAGSQQMTLFNQFVSFQFLRSDGSPYSISNIPADLQYLNNYDYTDPIAINAAFQPIIMQYFAPEMSLDEGRKGPLKGGVYVKDWRVQFTTGATVLGVPTQAQVHFLQYATVVLNSNFKLSVEVF